MGSEGLGWGRFRGDGKRGKEGEGMGGGGGGGDLGGGGGEDVYANGVHAFLSAQLIAVGKGLT